MLPFKRGGFFIGNEDVSLIRYYEDNGRYADLINGFVFEGKQVVSKENICEVDSRKSSTDFRSYDSESRHKKEKYRQRYRDFVRKIIFGVNCVVIAVENQSSVSYAMPVRVMDGDAMEYVKQLNQIRRKNKNENQWNSQAEFLERFKREDRLPATFSLVIYYGEEPWDGATDLYDLLDLTNIPEELKKLVNHYPIHVLDVRRFEHTDWFHTDLREVFEFIQCSNDEHKLMHFIESRKEQLSNLAVDAWDVISSVGKITNLSFYEEKYRTSTGGVDMCKGLEDWGKSLKEEGRVEGHAEGRVEGHAEGLVVGHAKGCSETQRRYALALFNDGMTLEKVSQLFDLDINLATEWYNEWRSTT